MDSALGHRDCRNYAPVDAAKGLCRASSGMTPADGKPCERFSRLPRCGWCAGFRAEPAKPGLGVCASSAHQFFAYADMAAKTCADFKARV